MSSREFADCIDQYMRPVTEHSDTRPVLIVGDFNIDARQSQAIQNIQQFVTSPTHISGSILDHVYWTGSSAVLSTNVIACHWSDHNIVAVAVSSSSSDLPSLPAVTAMPVPLPSATKSNSFVAASATVTSVTSASRPTTRSRCTADTLSVQHSSRCSQNLSTMCQFLDGALGPHRMQFDINVSVQDILHQHNLKVRPAPGNGHCLLHAWAAAIKCTVKDVKDMLMHEFEANSAGYIAAGISANELQRYLRSRTYTLDAVNTVVDMLCNAYQATAFIIGPKYD